MAIESADLVRKIEEDNKTSYSETRQRLRNQWKTMTPEKAVEELKIRTWAELDAAIFMATALSTSARELTLRGDFDILESLAKQVWDECRHARYCAMLAETLGGKVDAYNPSPFLERLYNLSRENAAKGDLVSLHASNMLIGESTTLALFLGMKDACEETGRFPELLRICRIVERDEMFHVNNGRRVVKRYATTEELQERVRIATSKWIELSKASRNASTPAKPT